MSDDTEWALDHVVHMFPGEGYEPAIALLQLTDALEALTGLASGKTLFGLAAARIDPDRVPQLLALVRDAFVAWRAWCVEHDQTGWLETIDRVLALPQLPPG